MRRAFAIIPLFLAALLAQIYAPVGASLAMRAAGPGLGPICVTNPASDENAPKAPDACCDLCAFVASGAAPLAPVFAPFAPTRPEPRRIAWRWRDGDLVLAAGRTTAQARAPPFAS